MRRLVALLVALGVLASSGAALAQSITVDGAANSGALSLSGTLSANITIGAGSNRALFAFVSLNNDARSVTAAAWNTSETATAVCTAGGTGNGTNLAVYRVTNPTTGAHTFSATIDSPTTGAVMLISLRGVDQTAPVSASVCDAYLSSSSAAHSHNTTSPANGLVLDAFSLQRDGGTLAAAAGQTTPSVSPSFPTDDGTNIVTLTHKAGSGTVTTGYAWDNDFYRWAHATVAVAAAGGAPSGGSLMLMGVGR